MDNLRQTSIVTQLLEKQFNSIINSGLDFDEFRNKTILITGSTGMVLSYFVYFLVFLNETNALDIKIILLSSDRNLAERKYYEYLSDSFVVIGDLQQCISNVDYVIHGRSFAQTSYFTKKPVDIMYSNIFLTKELLQVCKKNVNCKFLYISSSAVYGNNKNKCLTENDFGEFNSDIEYCYAESKRAGQMLCNSYHTQYGVKTYIARLAHSFGPTIDLDNDQRIFANIVRSILNNTELIINNGKQSRTFTYLEDVVSGFIHILIQGFDGNTYNVINETNIITLTDLGNLIKNKWGIVVEILKETDIDRPTYSSHKLCSQTNFKFSYNIFQCFENTINYIKNKKEKIK